MIDTARAVAVVAREFGLGEQLLDRWVHAERARLGPVDVYEFPRDYESADLHPKVRLVAHQS